MARASKKSKRAKKRIRSIEYAAQGSANRPIRTYQNFIPPPTERAVQAQNTVVTKLVPISNAISNVVSSSDTVTDVYAPPISLTSKNPSLLSTISSQVGGDTGYNASSEPLSSTIFTSNSSEETYNMEDIYPQTPVQSQSNYQLHTNPLYQGINRPSLDQWLYSSDDQQFFQSLQEADNSRADKFEDQASSSGSSSSSSAVIELDQFRRNQFVPIDTRSPSQVIADEIIQPPTWSNWEFEKDSEDSASTADGASIASNTSPENREIRQSILQELNKTRAAVELAEKGEITVAPTYGGRTVFTYNDKRGSNNRTNECFRLVADPGRKEFIIDHLKYPGGQTGCAEAGHTLLAVMARVATRAGYEIRIQSDASMRTLSDGSQVDYRAFKVLTEGQTYYNTQDYLSENHEAVVRSNDLIRQRTVASYRHRFNPITNEFLDRHRNIRTIADLGKYIKKITSSNSRELTLNESNMIHNVLNVLTTSRAPTRNYPEEQPAFELPSYNLYYRANGRNLYGQIVGNN